MQRSQSRVVISHRNFLKRHFSFLLAYQCHGHHHILFAFLELTFCIFGSQDVHHRGDPMRIDGVGNLLLL